MGKLRAEPGLIYIRGEYPAERRRLRHASSATAPRPRLLGGKVMGAGLRSRHRGAAGSREPTSRGRTARKARCSTRRGEAGPRRQQPPFPAQSAVRPASRDQQRGKTLLWRAGDPGIGGPAFAAIGRRTPRGTGCSACPGCVEQPGLYEYEFGVTPRPVIRGGGRVWRGGRPMRAVLIGGRRFVRRAERAGFPLNFEGGSAIERRLGLTGVVLVLDDQRGPDGLLRRSRWFFRDGPAASCVPAGWARRARRNCWGGWRRGAQIGSVEERSPLVDDIGAVARDASICGMGQRRSRRASSELGA